MKGFIYKEQSTENILSSSKLILVTFDSLKSITGSERENIVGEKTLTRHIPNEYGTKTSNLIFEYALVDGVNSSQECAAELAAKLRGINCHVNLIPLNSVEERHLNGVTRKYAYKFRDWLEELHISATVRRELGTDIDGACGQLRNKFDESRRNEQ